MPVLRIPPGNRVNPELPGRGRCSRCFWFCLLPVLMQNHLHARLTVYQLIAQPVLSYWPDHSGNPETPVAQATMRTLPVAGAPVQEWSGWVLDNQINLLYSAAATVLP